MSLHRTFTVCLLWRFPRVSGDEPVSNRLHGKAKWFSPRERG